MLFWQKKHSFEISLFLKNYDVCASQAWQWLVINDQLPPDYITEFQSLWLQINQELQQEDMAHSG